MAHGGAGPRALDRRSPLPLWAQLSEDLVRRLEHGEFTRRFPTEHELVDEYGVSRHTVRDAVRRLRDHGLLDTARGRGTWIRQDRIDQPLGAIYSLSRAVEARGMEPHNQVLALDIRSDPVAARRLEVPDDARLLHLARLRLAGGEPLALDEAWLPADVAEPLLDADFSRTGLYDQLVARAGVRVTGGRERLRAVLPTTSQRRALAIDETIAVFAVERLARADDRPVEWRTTFVRGDRFRVVAAWSPRTGYLMDISAWDTGRAAARPVSPGASAASSADGG